MRYDARSLSLLALGVLLPLAAAAEPLDAERAAFREAYAEAERGAWALTPAQRELLGDYVLWPDLRAAYLRATLGRVPDAEVRAFLERHGDLKPARELRYRFALSLAERGLHDEFLALYHRHYESLEIERLDCLALAAKLADGLPASLPARARELWLVGHSQVAECDTVFTRLTNAGLIDEELYRQRFALAIDGRELAMARYLSRSLTDEHRREAANWTRAVGLPREFLAENVPKKDSDSYRRQLVAAIERLAYDDPQLAAERWRSLAGGYAFSKAQRDFVARHVTLWLARHHAAGAYEALLALPESAVDAEVRRWRVRSGLREHAWTGVLDHIASLPPGERDSAQWQYWRAIAMQQAGHPGAEPILSGLAAERSYYGFLAADALGRDYDFSHSDLPADEVLLERLAGMPALVRARELFLVGLEGRGRSEWDAAVRRLDADARLQAAVLAHRWGWHSRAIATAADGEQYDDLNIRYPLPFAEAFAEHARAASVSPSWALGVARSESLFMADVRSPAGAIGVMQVMPGTGRLTARELQMDWHGRVTLTDPAANIRLGTWFLGRMQERFANNPVLATAAYNAGPLRVEAWLPQRTALDARIWIETIPYAETRRYVRRVLTADTIFAWRLAGRPGRLSARLPEIPAAAPRVAAVRAGSGPAAPN